MIELSLSSVPGFNLSIIFDPVPRSKIPPENHSRIRGREESKMNGVIYSLERTVNKAGTEVIGRLIGRPGGSVVEGFLSVPPWKMAIRKIHPGDR